MALFLIFFFILYGLLHLYAFLKARAAFGFGPISAWLILFAMTFMVVAPVAVRLAEFRAPDQVARILAFVGYTWMGLIFLFVCGALVMDLCRVITCLVGKALHSDLLRFAPTAKARFYVPMIVSLFAAAYGSVEASRVRCKEIIVRTSKIPPRPGVFRIAQVSDVHLGLLLRQYRLSGILDVVKRADPDMLVSTGDLVDGPRSSLNGLDELLLYVKPPCGKFAVTGNHDFYAGIEHSLDFTQKAGFRVLRGEAKSVNGWLTVAGVDDPAGPGYGQERGETELHILSQIPRERFVLLLKHRPSVNPLTLGRFDLQLSGHVHGGQIFPFRLLTRLFYAHVSGYYPLNRGSSLHVSKGSGTWGPPIRFLAPPEVTIVTLVYEGGK